MGYTYTLTHVHTHTTLEEELLKSLPTVEEDIERIKSKFHYIQV